jgi:WD40 repeat protein
LEFGNPKPILSVPHERTIDHLVYSANAKWLAAATFELDSTGGGPASEVTIFDGETGKEWMRLETSGTMTDFAFSPVGDLAAALEGGNAVMLWDIAKKSAPRELDTGRVGAINLLSGWDRVFFSTDGNLIGVAGNSRLRIWDASSGNLKMAKDLEGVIRWLKFSDKGNLVAITSGSGDIQVWDIAEERMISLVPSMPGRVLLPVRFGHVNQILQVTDEKGNVQLWQIDNQQETWRWPHLPLSWLPDSQRFLVSEEDNFFLWDANHGSVTVSNTMPATVSLLAVRPDGKMLAVADAEGSVQLFTLPNLEPGPKTKSGPFPRVLQWSPSGGSLVAVADRHVSQWSAPNLREQTFEPAAYDPDKLVFSPDGRYFTVGYAPRNYGGPESVQPLQLWDSRTGEVIRQVAHGQVPEYVGFAAHSPYLVSSAQGLIRIWEYPDLRELAKWNASQQFPSIALSPNGSAVAGVVDDKTIGIWKVPSGERLGTIQPDGKPTSVAFTPDSRAIVTVSNVAEGTALTQAWSWPELKVVTRFPTGSGPGPAISFSPDGSYLVLHQIDHLERYLWRTKDLIPQGCRTLIEVAAGRVGLPSWCGARPSEAPDKDPDSVRAEPTASAKSRIAH